MEVLAGKVALNYRGQPRRRRRESKVPGGRGAAVIVNYLEREGGAVEVVHAIQDKGWEAISHRADITD